MDPANYVKSLLCLLAWREENINGVNGMLGVMFCIRNRVNARWSDGQWLGVMTSHNQFSSMTVVGDGQTVKYPDPRDPNFQRVLQLVDSVFDGTYPDTLTNGALYYCDPGKGITPGGWFERNIQGNPTEHPQCAKIGSTLYFK